MRHWLLLFLYSVSATKPWANRRFLRGVSPEKFSFYQPANKEFRCLDSSSVIPYKWINDDYCDCKDGSDEPGTSACSNGVFYCTNTGFQPRLILSSRVNDGVCDCCDGSDEYSKYVICRNNCIELGDEMKKQEEVRARLFARGHESYLHYCDLGKQIKEENQLELGQLETEVDDAESLEVELEFAKNDSEAVEKKLKDAARKDFDETNPGYSELLIRKHALEAFKLIDVNGDEKLNSEELRTFFQSTDDVADDAEFGESQEKYELPKPVDFEEFLLEVWNDIKEDYANKVGFEDEEQNENANDPGGHDVEPQLEYNQETKEAIARADSARSAFNEQEQKVNELNRKLENTKKLLELDSGTNLEFLPLYNQCIDYTYMEYLYTLCPFQHATQKSRDGSGYTVLGNWNSWIGQGADRYSVMYYDEGYACWNGPNRSVKVYMECGDSEEITSVSEPNRCEYLFAMKTPAMCTRPPPRHPSLHDPSDL